MSYIDLINRFWRIYDNSPFTANETKIFFYLLRECNRRGWPDHFEISNNLLTSATEIPLSSLKNARAALAEAGVLKYDCGDKNKSNPSYTLNFVDDSNACSVKDMAQSMAQSTAQSTAKSMAKSTAKSMAKSMAKSTAKNKADFEPIYIDKDNKENKIKDTTTSTTAATAPQQSAGAEAAEGRNDFNFNSFNSSTGAMTGESTKSLCKAKSASSARGGQNDSESGRPAGDVGAVPVNGLREFPVNGEGSLPTVRGPDQRRAAYGLDNAVYTLNNALYVHSTVHSMHSMHSMLCRKFRKGKIKS